MSRTDQLAQKNSLKIKPEREAEIQRFWVEERALTDAALLARVKRFAGCYPRYRDLKILRALLKVGLEQLGFLDPGKIRTAACLACVTMCHCSTHSCDSCAVCRTGIG